MAAKTSFLLNDGDASNGNATAAVNLMADQGRRLEFSLISQHTNGNLLFVVEMMHTLTRA